MQEMITIPKKEYETLKKKAGIEEKEPSLKELKKMSKETGVPVKVYQRMFEATRNVKKKTYTREDIEF